MGYTLVYRLSKGQHFITWLWYLLCYHGYCLFYYMQCQCLGIVLPVEYLLPTGLTEYGASDGQTVPHVLGQASWVLQSWRCAL